MSPERPNLVLTSYIPYIKLDILVGDRFDIEANSWDGGNVLVEL